MSPLAAANHQAIQHLARLVVGILILLFFLSGYILYKTDHDQYASCVNRHKIQHGSHNLLYRSARANQAVADDGVNGPLVHQLRTAEAKAQRAQVRTLERQLAIPCKHLRP